MRCRTKKNGGWTVENAFSSSFFFSLTFPPRSADGRPSVPCLGFDLYPALFCKCILGRQQTYNSPPPGPGSILKKRRIHLMYTTYTHYYIQGFQIGYYKITRWWWGTTSSWSCISIQPSKNIKLVLLTNFILQKYGNGVNELGLDQVKIIFKLIF